MTNIKKQTPYFVQSQIELNINVGSIGRFDQVVFPTHRNKKLIRSYWPFNYWPAEDANESDAETNNNPIKMSIQFTETVWGKVFVESIGLPTKVYSFPKSTKFEWDYLFHKDVHAACVQSFNVKIKVSIEIFVTLIYHPEIPSFFESYDEIPTVATHGSPCVATPTDFEIHCKDKQYSVHKDVLAKISPVFEAMFCHDFVEKSSNKLAIDDFDSKTIETALNIIYGRPHCKLTVKIVIDLLYFARKYLINDVFLETNLSITNVCAILRYAVDFEKLELFTKCANFFKLNENEIKRTDEFAALSEPQKIRLYKSAYRLKTEIDAFLYLHRSGTGIGIEHIKITTPADFVKVANYAWEDCGADLKMACAKYFIKNRDEITESLEYYNLNEKIQYSLNVRGRM